MGEGRSKFCNIMSRLTHDERGCVSAMEWDHCMLTFFVDGTVEFTVCSLWEVVVVLNEDAWGAGGEE